MAKDELREAIEGHAEATHQDVDSAPAPAGRKARPHKLVIRLSDDELRRIQAYCDAKSLPLSTGVRSSVLELIRRA